MIRGRGRTGRERPGSWSIPGGHADAADHIAEEGVAAGELVAVDPFVGAMGLFDAAGAADDTVHARALIDSGFGAVGDEALAIVAGGEADGGDERVGGGEVERGEFVEDFEGESAAGVGGFHPLAGGLVQGVFHAGEQGVGVVAGDGAPFDLGFGVFRDDIQRGAAVGDSDLDCGVRRIEAVDLAAFEGESAGFGGDPGHGLAQGVQGVDAFIGAGRVACLAVDGESDGEAAFMGDDGDHEGWFPDDAPFGEEIALRGVFHGDAGAVAGDFLIEGIEQVDGSAQRHADDVGDGGKCAGDEAFHVGGAARNKVVTIFPQSEGI